MNIFIQLEGKVKIKDKSKIVKETQRSSKHAEDIGTSVTQAVYPRVSG